MLMLILGLTYLTVNVLLTLGLTGPIMPLCLASFALCYWLYDRMQNRPIVTQGWKSYGSSPVGDVIRDSEPDGGVFHRDR